MGSVFHVWAPYLLQNHTRRPWTCGFAAGPLDLRFNCVKAPSFCSRAPETLVFLQIGPWLLF